MAIRPTGPPGGDYDFGHGLRRRVRQRPGPSGEAILTPPVGAAAFADFAKDIYYLGPSLALFDEILVADPPNWGAWSNAANRQDGIGLIYNEVTAGVPLFAPGLLPAMTADDGFSLIIFGSITNIPSPQLTPVEITGQNEIGVRIIREGIDFLLENLNVGYSLSNNGSFGTHGAVFYTSIDDFGGTYRSGVLEPYHSVQDTFKVGITATPGGKVVSVADRLDPLSATDVQLVHVDLDTDPDSYVVDDWAGIVLYFIDSNLENPQRLIIEQLTVYAPALSDSDLFIETQSFGPHV